MLPAATAVRILAPASVAVVLFIYKYFKSGAKTEVPDHLSPHPPGGGGGGAPPHPQDDRAPPNLDPAVLDKILNLVNAHLEANRHLRNAAVLDEIMKLIRNSDPADDIVDKVEKLCLEENKPGEQEPASTNGPSSSTETESPTTVQGTRLDHAASDLEPATLEVFRSLDPAVLGEILKLGPLILDQIRNQRAVRFPAGECWTYLKTGTCKDRSSCKFKHPPRSKDKQNDFKSEGCKNGKASKSNHSRGQPYVAPNFMGSPIPPVSKDKAKGKEGLAKKPGRPESKVSKDKAKEKGAQKPGRTESKNDFRSEGCKNAKVRTSNHSRGQPSVAPAGENFLGLPIRPGQKKCPYYMQNGSCKYGLSCKYNHPDPEAAGESHPVSRYGNDGPATFQGASPSTEEPSSARRSLNKTRRYVPPMASANLPERSMPVPQPYGIDNSVTETSTYQPDPLEKRFLLVVCDFFSKTGYCRKLNCNYHHPPKYQTSVSPSCELSDKGLPLRPGRKICTQYSTNGICNSGPSCKFDHPSSPNFTL